MPRLGVQCPPAVKVAVSSLGMQGLTSFLRLQFLWDPVHAMCPAETLLCILCRSFCSWVPLEARSLNITSVLYLELVKTFQSLLSLCHHFLAGMHPVHLYMANASLEASAFEQVHIYNLELTNKSKERLSHGPKYRSPAWIMARGWMKQNIARVQVKQNAQKLDWLFVSIILYYVMRSSREYWCIILHYFIFPFLFVVVLYILGPRHSLPTRSVID